MDPDPKRQGAQSRERTLRAIRSGYHGEYMSYATPKQLFAAIPPKRWVIIETLQQIGPVTLRGLARALDRDVKRVHEDVAALLEDGIAERDDHGKLFVPFASIRIAAEIRAPAAA